LSTYEKAFFSFTQILHSSDHRAYNRWHQLDHRPENLALTGVGSGERWVRTPECREISDFSPLFSELHYVNSYLFQSPANEAIIRWQELAERSFQWGRREDIHLSQRLLMEFFRPIRTYVSPNLRLSNDALPHRPNRGIYLVATEEKDPRSTEAEKANAWWDSEYIPQQIRRTGVVGCMTFASETNFSSHADMVGVAAISSIRISVFYLDEDPLEVSKNFDLATKNSSSSIVLSAGPLLAIQPWSWDWFDPKSE